MSLPEIKATAVEARQTMDTWKQAYLDVRKKIEQSGRDARWEFDRKKLFERSDYIAQVCSDIYDIAQVSLMLNSYIVLVFFFLYANHSLYQCENTDY